jgi:hypothetical protein
VRRTLLPDSELPDLRLEACPKSTTVGSLVLRVCDECPNAPGTIEGLEENRLLIQ